MIIEPPGIQASKRPRASWEIVVPTRCNRPIVRVCKAAQHGATGVRWMVLRTIRLLDANQRCPQLMKVLSERTSRSKHRGHPARPTTKHHCSTMLIHELVSVLPYIAAEIHRAGLRSPKRIRVHIGRWWQLLRVRLQLRTASAHAQNMYMDASIIIPKTHSQAHDAFNLKTELTCHLRRLCHRRCPTETTAHCLSLELRAATRTSAVIASLETRRKTGLPPAKHG